MFYSAVLHVGAALDKMTKDIPLRMVCGSLDCKVGSWHIVWRPVWFV